MPYKPKHPCGKRDCPELVESGQSFCLRHKKEESRRYDKGRGTTAERGYGARWRKIRALYLKKHPYCESAEHIDHGVLATEVHHIRQFSGVHDPLYWNHANLMALCKGCHSRETLKKGRGNE